MIQLNVNPKDQTGQPVAGAIITLFVYDAVGRACPIEPAIRTQSNFYNGQDNQPYFPAGYFAPFMVYGTVAAPGYQLAAFGPIEWDTTRSLDINVLLTFNTPANWTVDQLCAVRGAMWTARLDVPFGPRPGDPSNINALDYLEAFDAPTRARMLAAYGPTGQGYTHCVDGPMYDAGYHGQYPAIDYRHGNSPAAWWAIMRAKWAAGICPIHFAYPDLYGFGDDALDRFFADFEGIYRSAAAQALIKILIPYGWERGYEVTSAQWVRMLQWARRVLPNALIGIHLRADQDAPTGGDDDKIPGWTNGKAWQAVAPYTHLWFVQNGGYVDGPSEVPTPEFIGNFTEQFNPLARGSLAYRFRTGYPGDWARGSAFGDDVPIRLVAGEYASYADYWKNWAERYAQGLGDQAIAFGAWGALDGCMGGL